MPTLTYHGNNRVVYWLLYRNDKPIFLIRWDTHEESCGVTLNLNEQITVLSKPEFETHVAFGTFPVLTMDEYREEGWEAVRARTRT